MPDTSRARASKANGKLGGRPSVQTKCPRCGRLQPSARAAWRHCRKPNKRTTNT